MLTKSEINGYKPRKKVFKIFDGNGTGLHVAVMPTGSKLFRLKYRFGGKERLLSLGAYPKLAVLQAESIKQARAKAAEARELLDAGKDPAEHGKSAEQAEAQQAAETFEAVTKEWLALGCPGGRGSPSAATVERDRGRLDAHVLGTTLAGKPIAEIKAPEILAVIRKIEARGRHETAHRVLGLMSRVFRFAFSCGTVTSDPTRDLRGALKPVETTSHAAIVDPAGVGALLRLIDEYRGLASRSKTGTGAVIRAALQLMALVFVRPGELRQARWAEFTLDGDKPQWVVPAERMKMRAGDHIVPLSAQAVAILRELAKTTNDGPDSFVFPGLKSGRAISENTMNVALRSMGIGGDLHVSHGFRTTASTLLHELGHAPEVIEAQLAHVRGGVAGIYNRSNLLPQRRKMMSAWADYLDQLRDPESNVTPIRHTESA
ncbi:MAG TPA: integrase arm-type DNA-binding domain-containing protein [Gammaproteobacteria bacterium]|nr:integrase arm-type DNA-binding domain-containing protein [Gammaproteobacteria bacterium]